MVLHILLQEDGICNLLPSYTQADGYFGLYGKLPQ